MHIFGNRIDGTGTDPTSHALVRQGGASFTGVGSTRESEPDVAGSTRLSGLTLAAVVIGLIATSSGGDDAKVASGDTTDRKPVTVVIAGTNDALEPVTDGGITGEGTFRATGAITDSGTARGYRWLKGDEATGWQISLRHVTKGQEGRDHICGQDRYVTKAGYIAMDDRVCDKGVRRATGRRQRNRERHVHHQLSARDGMALTRRALSPGSRRRTLADRGPASSRRRG